MGMKAQVLVKRELGFDYIPVAAIWIFFSLKSTLKGHISEAYL